MVRNTWLVETSCLSGAVCTVCAFSGSRSRRVCVRLSVCQSVSLSLYLFPSLKGLLRGRRVVYRPTDRQADKQAADRLTDRRSSYRYGIVNCHRQTANNNRWGSAVASELPLTEGCGSLLSDLPLICSNTSTRLLVPVPYWFRGCSLSPARRNRQNNVNTSNKITWGLRVLPRAGGAACIHGGVLFSSL